MEQETEKTIKITLDPTDHYLEVGEVELMNACGYIPFWVCDEEQEEKPLQELLEANYPFGMYQMTGEVMEGGVYRSPYHEPDPETGESDPDLHPLIKIERKGETLYQYPYAIVAFKRDDSDKWFITRMD